MTAPTGKPRGRPKGGSTAKKKSFSAEKALQLTSDMLMDALPEIIGKVIEQALAGSESSQKNILDRLVPTKKAIEHTSKLVGGKTLPNVNIIIAPSAPEKLGKADKILEVKPEVLETIVPKVEALGPPVVLDGNED